MEFAGFDQSINKLIRRRALVTSANGQDGVYLTHLLLDKGYEVHGLLSAGALHSLYDSAALDEHSRSPHARLFLHHVESTDPFALRRVLEECLPDEIYHVSGSVDGKHAWANPDWVLESVTQSTVRLLECYREHAANVRQEVRFIHAGCAQMFGNYESVCNEKTPRCPVTPYAIARDMAFRFCKSYRHQFKLPIRCGILFHRESPFGGSDMPLRRIARAAARNAVGIATPLPVGELHRYADWGYAGDFAEALWRIAQHSENDDFIVATGEPHTTRETLDLAFSMVGLKWASFVNSIETDRLLVGDPSKLCKATGWAHQISWESLVEMMMDAEAAHAETVGKWQHRIILPRSGTSTKPEIPDEETNGPVAEAADSPDSIASDSHVHSSEAHGVQEVASEAGPEPESAAPAVAEAFSDPDSAPSGGDIGKRIRPAAQSGDYRMILKERRRRVYVAGHNGLIGSALLRRLFGDPDVDLVVRDSSQLDLTDPQMVDSFFEEFRPDEVYLAAGKTGDRKVLARHCADFLRENARIHMNVMDAAVRYGSSKLLVVEPSTLPLARGVGATGQPFRFASEILNSYQNQFGIGGVVVVPTPVFGPGAKLSEDSTSTVMALIALFQTASYRRQQEVVVPGGVNDLVPCIDADSLADACVFLMEQDCFCLTRVRLPHSPSMGELARLIAGLMGFHGSIRFAPSVVPSQTNVVLDADVVNLGWKPAHSLGDAIRWTLNCSQALPVPIGVTA